MRWDPKHLPKPSTHVKYALSYSMLVAPILAFFYSVLLPYSVTGAQSTVGRAELSFLTMSWLLTTLVLIQYQAKQQRSTYITALVVYHMLLVAYLSVTTGSSSPVVYAWPIVGVMTFSQTGLRGYAWASVALLCGLLAPVAIVSDALSPAIALVTFFAVSLVSAALIFTYVTELETSSRQPEESNPLSKRDRLSAIINNLADAVISTDRHGKVTTYNSASLNLLDTNKNLDGIFIDDIMGLKTETDEAVSLFDLLSNLNAVKVSEDYFIEVDEETIRLSITMSPIKRTYSGDHRGSETRGYALIIRDITHEKSLEQEKDEFISVVSHELRTPITIAEGAISNAQLLIEREKTKSKKSAESLRLAHDQTVFLAKIINDLSTLSRAERGFDGERTRIDIRALVDDMYKEYESQAKAAGLIMNLDSIPHGAFVTTSELYLREIMQNFITNALKYTREGSITLILKADDKHITFSVKDTGIGIGKADQNHVYEKFFRSEDYRTRETGGTGLGLYVAAKLANKIGATIEMKSRLNHGSTFSLMLPTDSTDKA